MKKRLLQILTLSVLASTLVVSCVNPSDSSSSESSSENISGSEQTPSHKVYDNDTTPLVFASQDLDGVFNPFYYSTGPDGQIVGMTQLSMFTTDKEANIAYGKDEAVVVLDYQEVFDEDKNQTTYTFVIKNPTYNVKFSNGSYLTMKDVLFNLYEYLDPQYTGSSTMYSTNIVGLKEYRTQQASESGQENFEKKFTLEAEDRVSQLVTVIQEIYDANTIVTNDLLLTQLQQKETEYSGNSEFKYSDLFVEDYKYVGETFKKELETDFINNKDTYEDYDLTSDIQTFFYVEGLITIDLDKPKTDPERIDFGGWDSETISSWNDGQPMTQQQAIDIVYDSYYPEQFTTIANYWATATTIREQFVADAKDKYFAENANNRIYKDISGIKVITEDTTVNGTTYKYAQYDETGKKTAGADGGYEMFSITIDGVDPKAIWNFSFSVAPMYYYSNEEQIKKFNYGLSKTEDPCFGVEYGSLQCNQAS